MDIWETNSWERQGGYGTKKSFGTAIPDVVKGIFDNAVNYHIEDNRVFVHGGFSLNLDLDKHGRDYLIWDRDLIADALHAHIMHVKHGHKSKISKYAEIYVGHTPVHALSKDFNKSDRIVPTQFCELWAIDTGASYDGPLTLMRIDEELNPGVWNHQIWQSEPVCSYYPGIKARG